MWSDVETPEKAGLEVGQHKVEKQGRRYRKGLGAHVQDLGPRGSPKGTGCLCLENQCGATCASP
jgi:hypothetical protein